MQPAAGNGVSVSGLTAGSRTAKVAAPVRVAVVGCGAIAREHLLPVLTGHERLTVTTLVDVNEATARGLAEAYRIPHVLTDIARLDHQHADAVVVATPPALHAPQVVSLAPRGFHLFVEKPMAVDSREGEQMIRAADDAGVVLAVGLYRRLLPSTRLLRGLIESGIIGAPIAIDIEEGGEYGWALATLANLTPGLGGGGVLIDIGSHLLDVLAFLMPGPIELLSYADNARGGVETDALMMLRVTAGSRDVPCRVELSRTRRLRNSIVVEGERGVLELPRGEFADVQVRFSNVAVSDALEGQRPIRVSARWGDEEPPIGYEAFRAEVDDWIDAVTGGGEPALTGRSALASVQLIEQAYQSKRPLLEPWTVEGLTAPPVLKRSSRARVRRVLITGASGFIGCRTAEILSLREGCEVRALVRNPSNAARLARLPIEMIPGDVCSKEAVERAIEGCDAVVHCAVGTSWQQTETAHVTVEGTRTMAEAARRADVQRFVHISSIAVHGAVEGPTLDESTPLIDPRAVGYSGDKRRAEDAVRDLVTQGLRAVILRPARVYGPFGKTFITRPLQHLSRRAFALSGAYDGPSSMVYVDNVVEGILRAIDCEESALGEAFNISDIDQLSWREFYQTFGDAIGAQVLLRAESNGHSSAATPGLWSRWRRGIGEVMMSAELRGFARKCIQTDPVGVLPRKIWEGMPSVRRRLQQTLGMTDTVIYRRPAPAEASQVVFNAEAALVVVDKAARVLGYRPVVGRARAMELTLEWARHSRIA